MKKQLKILIVFFMVWAPLGAQTFEKTIRSSTSDYVPQIIINDKDEIILSIISIDQHSLPNFTFANKRIHTKLIVLNEVGKQLHQQKISAYDFNPAMDSSLENFNTLSGVYNNNQYLLSGTSRIDTPLVYANVIYTLDSNFSILNYRVQDTTTNDVESYVRIKKLHDKFYAIGVRSKTSQFFIEGLISSIDDSLRLHSYSLFNANDSLFLRLPIDFLIDDERNTYFFGEGTLPNMATGSNMQLVKTDSNLNLIKQEYVNHPLLPNEVNVLLNELSINSFWISDTTFLLAATGISPIDSEFRGDIHLFVYDTSLQQQKYKRIVSRDSTAFNFTYKAAVYDSISECFYMGVTRKFETWFSPIFGSKDTTDFQLTKFDKDLNVLFQRNYRRNKTMTFNTLATDSKGNVIMAGMIQDINSLDFFNTDIFVLKVDSLGNINHPTGYAEKDKINLINYRVYPNPSSGAVNFIQYNIQEEYKMRLYNSQGSLVGNYIFKNFDNHFDISNLPNGVYVYNLSDSQGRKASGKIVKQD